MEMSAVKMRELERKSKDYRDVVGEIVRMEKKIFPKHESLAEFFDQQLNKKNSGLLYLQLNAEVVGYVMYAWPSSLTASITKLAVKESYRRKGHGEALMKAAIDKCKTRNVLRIELHVDPMRTSAMSLYEKLGFSVDNFIHGYYSPDRNAYRMYLDFQSN